MALFVGLPLRAVFSDKERTRMLYFPPRAWDLEVQPKFGVYEGNKPQVPAGRVQAAANKPQDTWVGDYKTVIASTTSELQPAKS